MKDFQDRYSPMFRDTTRGAECCPTAESLADLASGRTWPWRRGRLVEHIAHCSHCADDYRVLTTARGGLVTALEAGARADQGPAAGWLRPGLTAAAALGLAALSVAVLVQMDTPSPAGDDGVLFASEFEPGPSASRRQTGPEQLFTSDFGEPDGEGGQRFRDDFGG